MELFQNTICYTSRQQRSSRIMAHTVFVLKTGRVQDLCSTSSQVTLSSFTFIYKREEFSLRGAAEKQLYALAPVSSSDQETPTPKTKRCSHLDHLAGQGAWIPAPISRQGAIHVCHYSGMGRQME